MSDPIPLARATRAVIAAIQESLKRGETRGVVKTIRELVRWFRDIDIPEPQELKSPLERAASLLRKAIRAALDQGKVSSVEVAIKSLMGWCRHMFAAVGEVLI